MNKFQDDILSQEDPGDMLGSIKKKKNTDPTHLSDSFWSKIPVVGKYVGTEFWEALITESLSSPINVQRVKELMACYDSAGATSDSGNNAETTDNP